MTRMPAATSAVIGTVRGAVADTQGFELRKKPWADPKCALNIPQALC
jgi:hypothetical protein